MIHWNQHLFSRNSHTSNLIVIEMLGPIEIMPVLGIPLVQEDDDIAKLIIEAIETSHMDLQNGDILVIAHTIVSKSEGRVIRAADVTPSIQSLEIAEENGFDAKQVEIAIQESKTVIRRKRALITEMKNGHV